MGEEGGNGERGGEVEGTMRKRQTPNAATTVETLYSSDTGLYCD